MHFYQEGANPRGQVTAEDRASLELLRRKIGGLLDQLAPHCAESERAFFVRLGPRSPKDAPMMVTEPWVSEAKIRAALEAAAANLSPEERSGENNACAHEVLRRFQDVCSGLMRVTSADEALALLLSSSRVMEDISRTLNHGKAGWDMSVVARTWDGDVRLEREFRTFVVGGELTAITQYDDQLAFAFVREHTEEIVSAIRQCHEQARPSLARLGLAEPAMAVIVDYLVVPGPEAWEARVIELNPFGLMTGGSLFTWSRDRRLLQGGRDVYGDLEDWETRNSREGVCAPWAEEKTVCGMPFRYLREHSPTFDWEHLAAFWEDYLRLAPPMLAMRPVEQQ